MENLTPFLYLIDFGKTLSVLSKFDIIFSILILMKLAEKIKRQKSTTVP